MMKGDYNEKENISAGSSPDISEFPEGFEVFDEAEEENEVVEEFSEAAEEEILESAEEELPEAVEKNEAQEEFSEAAKGGEAEQELPEAAEEIEAEQELPEAAEEIEAEEEFSEAAKGGEAEQELPEAAEEGEAQEEFSEAPEEIVAQEEFSEAAEDGEAQEEFSEAPEEIVAEEEFSEAAEEGEAEQELPEAAEEIEAEEEFSEAAEGGEAQEEFSEAPEEIEAEEEFSEAAEDGEAQEEFSEAPEEIVAQEELPEAAEETPATERITEFADDLSSAFNLQSEETQTDEGALYDSLSQLACELSDSGSEDHADDDDSMEYEDIADTMRRQNLEADAYYASVEDTEEEDEPVRIYVKDKGENAGTVLENMFVIDGAGEASASTVGETDLSQLPEEPEEEIGHTQVFEPVSVPSCMEQDEAFAGEYRKQKKKKYSFSKGMLQIAGLLVIVAGLAWVVSKATLSVNGEKDSGPADEYNYSASSVVIRPFVDDSEEESFIVPPFTVDKLKIGDKGDMVTAVQRTLASLGYLAAGKVSGTYDSATGEAVRQFQKANLLEATGEVNRETYELIFDSSAVAPTTRTTDLPTTTETETQPTQTETKPAPSETEATKTTDPVSDESSMSEPVSSTEEKKPDEESSSVEGEITEKTEPENSTTEPASSDDHSTTAENAEVAVG